MGAGIDLKTVQARLGHAEVSQTMNQYTHAIPANDRAAADPTGVITGTSAPVTSGSLAKKLKRTA
ncbi:MAG: hypothetical protein IKE22_04495 [Atopobiaceae bacterium]|nr:hypothetical protein [Atopobiaceae bacterium]